MISNLEGRVALVTGCTGGIGAAICTALGEAGAFVIGADLLPSDDARAKINAPKSSYKQLDVTNEDQWQKIIAEIDAEHGVLDILVHNAGVVHVEKLELTKLEDWRKMMAVNVDALFLGTKSAVALMAKTGATRPFGASIVNISSTAGLIGAALHTGYCASKGAVRLFNKAVAIEFANLGYKIRVNSVHPGGVKTGMVDHIMQRFVDYGFGESVDAMKEAMNVAHPIGRMADPLDIAKVVRFLASDESSYMHGSELVADGGFTAQ